MRYVVVGAGAIGGGIGGLLAAAGRDVTLVARGRHLDAIRAGGLELRTPSGSRTLPVPAAADVAAAGVGDGDVVILAVKLQDAAGALAELAQAADPGAVVLCAQNGVDGERQALRRFAAVYGMYVMMPATYLEPGVVEVADGVPGVLDVGRYPTGADRTAEAIVEDLSAAGFVSAATPAVMRLKYRKLLANLTNVIDAAAGKEARTSRSARAAQAEALAVFAAAGVDVASEEEERLRRQHYTGVRPLLPGGGESSSWQSLARGSGTIETEWLNGEVVLLGRLHGVPTPVNEQLVLLGRRMLAEGLAPGSVPVGELDALVQLAAREG